MRRMLPQKWEAARAGLVPALGIAGALCLLVAGVIGIASAQGGPAVRASASSSPSPSPSAVPPASARP